MNLERCHTKIGATNFFLAFSFCSQSLDRNKFLIVLVTLLLEVGVSITKVTKTWKLCNFSNLVTSITSLPKHTIPKSSSSLWAFWMIVKSVGQTPIFLLSLFFAFNFSYATFARVYHCFDFFQNFFLTFFNGLVITLKFIYLAFITLGFLFSSFLITLATFGRGLTLESVIWCAFLMWSFKWNLNLNGSYGHFFLLPSQDTGRVPGHSHIEPNFVSLWPPRNLPPIVSLLRLHLFHSP